MSLLGLRNHIPFFLVIMQISKKQIGTISLWSCDVLLKTVFWRDRDLLTMLNFENVGDCRETVPSTCPRKANNTAVGRCTWGLADRALSRSRDGTWMTGVPQRSPGCPGEEDSPSCSREWWEVSLIPMQNKSQMLIFVTAKELLCTLKC